MKEKQSIRIRKNGENREVFCIVRKRWIVCNDEELVRQQYIHLLIDAGYPEGSIGIEIGFNLLGVKALRADIVVYDTNGSPFLLIECKAKGIKIDQEVFRQASKYNSHFKAPYIILTNLNNNYIFHTEDFISYQTQDTIPSYPKCNNAK